MQLTAVFLLTVGLTASAGVYSQKVTLSEKSASLGKVFTLIEKQTGYSFFYQVELLEKTKPVDIQVNDADISLVLQLCFEGQPLTYSIVDKVIVVKFKEPVVTPVPVPLPPPPVDISGRITDKEGNPLAGASVQVKGKKTGTVTNADGVFVLKGLGEEDEIVISYTGFKAVTMRVGTRTSFVVSLEMEDKSLEEVVINKGYYTEKQKYSVGNVGKVTAKDIEKQPVQNPLLALQGRVPGLIITQNSGVPGGGVTVRIQGQNSILNGNDPFYVIDGVPFTSQIPSTNLGGNILGNSGGQINGFSYGIGNPLNYINPLDIESIEVLKDADATAIYGSRAANGAILITTKKGQVGSIKFDVNIQQGWGKVARRAEMLNTRQYLDMRYEAFKNDGISPDPSTDYDLVLWDTTRFTDWQKELIGNTVVYNTINASLSGGSSLIQYMLGGNYHRETTVFPGPFKSLKGSLHFSLTSRSKNQKLLLRFQSSFLTDNTILPGTDLTSTAVLMEPHAPALYNSDGTYNWMSDNNGNSTWSNPAAAILTDYSNSTKNLVSNLSVSYKLINGLDLKINTGNTFLLSNELSKIPLQSIPPENRTFTQRSASFGDRNMTSWVIEPQITYEKMFKNSVVNAGLGFSVNQNKSEGGSINAKGFISDEVISDIKAASTLSVGSTFKNEYKYAAAFGRINYILYDKYIVNLTARRDGSSRFGESNQFHNFYSIGGGWVFSNNVFFNKKIKFINYGKLRASYGTTGNDQIGDYSFISRYNSITGQVPYQSLSGLSPSGVDNPKLEWEETNKFQAGIDLRFFENRFQLNITYVRNQSSNQLLSYPLPSVTGFLNINNFNLPATVQNKSLELSMNVNLVKKDILQWSINSNITFPQNKVTKFPGIENSTFASGENGIIIGSPVGVLKLFHSLGVNPITGVYEVADMQGNATSNPNYSTDRNVLISTLPKYYGGFQNQVVFRNLEFDFLVTFSRQIGTSTQFNNGSVVSPGQFISGASNQPVSVLKRWIHPGDVAPVQRFSTNFSIYSQLAMMSSSDASYSDISYIRLKSIQIAWLPFQRFKSNVLQNLKFYAQGVNIITLTNYTGLDPESQNLTSLPPLRTFNIGIQLKF